MKRKIEDLEVNALKFWPERIAEMERNSSIIPKLIETQDKFISLLNVEANSRLNTSKIILSVGAK